MVRSLRHLLAAAMLVVSPGLFAAPCVSDTLANYITLGSCEIGTTSFTGFAALVDPSPGAVAIDPSVIQVTPSSSATEAGFAFAMTVAANAGDLLSALIQFTVTAGLGASVSGASAELAGSATGDGATTLLEEICFAAAFLGPGACTGAGTALNPFVIESDADLFEDTTFLGVSFVDVIASFVVDGGPSGTAALSGGTLLFATAPGVVPEPPAVILLSIGLTLLFAARTRRPSPTRRA